MTFVWPLHDLETTPAPPRKQPPEQEDQGSTVWMCLAVLTALTAGTEKQPIFQHLLSQHNCGGGWVVGVGEKSIHIRIAIQSSSDSQIPKFFFFFFWGKSWIDFQSNCVPKNRSESNLEVPKDSHPKWVEWVGARHGPGEPDSGVDEEDEADLLTRESPESTSSREIRLCPSLRSSYRSFTCFRTCGLQQTHFTL